MLVEIEKLVFGGTGMGHVDGKVAFVWNALPGETVEIEILQNKKTHIEGVATKILNPSPDRVIPRESHWLSSSPWQHIAWEKENYWKRAIAAETYSKFGGLILSSNDLEIVTDNKEYGYRNKIEFSFTELKSGEISLAFFERGKHHHIHAEGSLLAEPVINETAQYILQWINEQKIPMRSLKTLILRSDNEKNTIAALFIKDEIEFSRHPTLNDTLKGFHLYYSTHKSPASVPTKLLYSEGQNYLIANLKETKLKFGLLSFFQINLPVFDMALTDIAAFLHPHMPVVDFYSGVGAISLPLSQNRDRTTLVDNNAEAIQYAKENIILNKRQNCEAICLPAEDTTSAIQEDAMIILDPPRAGLHQKVVKQLLIKAPPRIIYLSCGIDTQARDLKLLSEAYRLTHVKLYNFFPRTPHIEGLCVLDRV
ncbi:MAG: methyltransferase [Patescibacteria group bacterium]